MTKEELENLDLRLRIIGGCPRAERADRLLFLQKDVIVQGELQLRSASGSREDHEALGDLAELRGIIAEWHAVELDLTEQEQTNIRAEGERLAALMYDLTNKEVLLLAAEMSAEAASKGAVGVEVDFGDER